MRTLKVNVFTLTAAALLLLGVPAAGRDGDSATGTAHAVVASPGEAVAIAADCGGCHGGADGEPGFAGGFPFATPMGTVYARNITPDVDTGIGGWTLEEFGQALREGKSKTVGNLYPAMPYTSYRQMTDEDVRALYHYFMNEVAPVANEVGETRLGFPFLRVSMTVWKALFIDSGTAPPLAGASEQVRRGQYLVDVLGHCGECHTPRGAMYQLQASSRHLGGASVGWYAPNISSDSTGIGDWPDAKLKSFLTRGKVEGAVAGGHMGLAVRNSLSRMPPKDIEAMVAYLKETRPVEGPPLAPPVTEVPPLDLALVEPVSRGLGDISNTTTTNGALLYLSACATCHGINGSLEAGGGPPLTRSRSVRRAEATNVVQAIVSGVTLGELAPRHLMPSFRADFSKAQIAAVTTYVRQRFGGFDDSVSTAQVERILKGSGGVPWLILNARWLAWLSLILAGLVLAGLVWRRTRP
ncbi:MAG: c-type cytochrome [Parahaliea sp.]